MLVFLILLLTSAPIFTQSFPCKRIAKSFIKDENPTTIIEFIDSLYSKGNFETELLDISDCLIKKEREYRIRALFLKKILYWTDSLRPHYVENKAFFYDDMGYFFYQVDDVDNSINALQKAEEYEISQSTIDSNILIQIYIHTSSTLTTMGDLKSAELYLYKAFDILNNLYSYSTDTKVRILIKLSEVLLQEGKYVEAEKIAFQGLDINDDISGPPKKDAILLTKLAHIYRAKGEYDVATKFLKDGLKIAKKHSPEEVGIYYDEIGICYYYLEEFNKAISFFQKAIYYQRLLNGEKHPDVINLSIRIATCYSFLGEHEKANKIFNESLTNLGLNLNNPKSISEINSVFIPISLFFKAQNHLFAYKETGDTTQLQKAHYWYGICLKVVEQINNSMEGESKQFLLSNFYYIFESIMETCYLQYELTGEERFIEEALDYSERSRSVLLRDAIKEATAEIMTAVPDSIIDRDDYYKKEIARVEEAVFENKRAGKMDEVVRLNGQMFNLKKESDRFGSFVKSHFPSYYRWRYKRERTSVKDVKKVLRTDEALLLYFWGDESLFTVLINNDSMQFNRQPIGEVKEQVVLFREAMNGYPEHRGDSLLNQYVASAHRLYELLIKPYTAQINKKVLIAPDGQLEYIAFDALLSDGTKHGNNWKKYDYLLKKYQFRYTHSIKVLLEHLNDKNRYNNQKLLAIAPEFSTPNTGIARRWGLGPIPKNEEEIRKISAYFKADLLKGIHTEKRKFLTRASKYAGLHFATHAIADDDNSGLSFIYFSPVANDTTGQEEVLYAKDICLMNLNADMVVLSACETAVGKNQRGEGIISIGRSFSFAGAKSLITTLWKVEDATAASMMTDFYRFLSQNDEKDAALRKAKLEVINQGKKHPFYWAAFVPYGDMSQVDFEKKSSIVWYLIVGLGLIIAAFYFFLLRMPNSFFTK